jgi:hypothetical protein
MTNRFKDDAEVEALLRAFESCELNPEEFKHYQHLAVALCYVVDLPFDEASARMCAGIKKLAAAYGKSGYHETITRFWLAVVRDFCLNAGPEDSLSSLANRLAETYDKDAIYEFYSRELIGSVEAKNAWVAPDIKPMPMSVAV